MLRAWHALLADALDGRVGVDELRRRHGRQFGGAKKVRSGDAVAPPGWPDAWPRHVVDVFDPRTSLPTVDDYVAAARAWASSTRAALDAALGPAVSG